MAVLGSNITIQCWVQGPTIKFYLVKVGDKNVPNMMETSGGLANFSLTKVDREDGRNYHCKYRPRTGFFISMPSDEVDLLIIDPDLAKPTISLHPTELVTLGGNVTIYCKSQDRAKNFYLQKPGDQMIYHPMETNGTLAKFSISSANFEHGGSYSCNYCLKSKPYVISQPSDLVELLITDPDLPRPNISLSPSRIALLGSNITIHCWVEVLIKTFYLYKTGDWMTLRSVKPDDGVMANFSINRVGSNHGGEYHCIYRPPSEFLISEPSNPMKLLILDPSLPRPAISISSGGSVALRGQVKIQCEIQEGPANFILQKAGDQRAKWPMKSNYDRGEFWITNISLEHKGNYTCSYALFHSLFVFSAPSDPLELLVSETEVTADYTHSNIIRFAIGGLTFLLLIYILQNGSTIE
ncbi:leukocyte immunoglobulin-like receptor subfamily A member 1 isoform X2 [Hemicordylus capensis]|nr:leukocyte immunoglobulin-like receptor subfamily A member 1 isoform X2 [Hemicordylus capensis]